MKRKNYITVSINDDELEKLKEKAEQEQRPLAQMLYIIISNELKKL